MAVAACALLVWALVASGHPGTDVWVLAVLSGFAVFFSVLSFSILRARQFSVENGLLKLPRPVRTAGGTRTREIQLREFSSLESLANPEGYLGLRITLRDGTTFYLWDPDLPPGAREYLIRLSHEAH
jgi:hypothetical protein